jgi:hypothetical protein
MREATPAELQRRLAREFDQQGWEYDLAMGPDLVSKLQSGGEVDAQNFVRALPSAFFQRNRTTRGEVAAAVERAVGGFVAKLDTTATTLTINDNRFQVAVGPGGQIVDSNINVGKGLQITVDATARKNDVLDAVAMLLRAGLAGGWNAAAALELASLIERREDIDLDDVRQITTEVVQAEQPKRGRLKELLNQVAVGGLGGALGTGISAGIGELISQLAV